MSRRRAHRVKAQALTVPQPLLDALAAEYGALNDPKTVAKIAAGIRELHLGLTKRRAKFIRDKYLRHERLRLAYATYSVCAQAPKLWPILDRVAPRLTGQRPLRIVEFGCGPGTAVSSFGLWAKARNQSIEYVATDRVAAVLDMCERLAARLHIEGVSTAHVDLSKRIARQLGTRAPFHVVLAMNVINELTVERLPLLTREFKRILADDGLVILIEPAAMGASRQLLEARAQFLEQGWSVEAPCTHQAECPLLTDESGWCHDVWPFERPDFMTDVDRIVGTRRETLKASWMVLSPRASESDMPRRGRVVSERFVEKGRQRAQVCMDGQIADVELQNRDVTPTNEAFQKVYRYDLIEIADTQSVGRAQRLTSQSVCRLIDEVTNRDA
ncbi:MAG: small ribosomal subunit Rsm22 family protein [Myxococcota bacterium]|nr:small ribosomal subunit Rsm22 family protein [Myxococcota bacterium]